MHDIALAYLEEIITTKHWMGPNSKLAVLSGLMINVDGEQPDVFEPKKFTILHAHVDGVDGVKRDLSGQTWKKAIKHNHANANARAVNEWTGSNIIQNPIFHDHSKREYN